MRTFCTSFALVIAFASVSAAGGEEEGPIYDAVMLLKDSFTLEGTFNDSARENLLEAHGLLAELAENQEDLSAEELIAVNSLESLTMYNLACLDAIDGDVEGALVWLEGAVGAGYTDADWMAEDPDLEPLHGDPRFEALLEEAYAVEEEMELYWGETSHSCEDCDGNACVSNGACR